MTSSVFLVTSATKSLKFPCNSWSHSLISFLKLNYGQSWSKLSVLTRKLSPWTPSCKSDASTRTLTHPWPVISAITYWTQCFFSTWVLESTHSANPSGCCTGQSEPQSFSSLKTFYVVKFSWNVWAAASGASGLRCSCVGNAQYKILRVRYIFNRLLCTVSSIIMRSSSEGLRPLIFYVNLREGSKISWE